jgi:hypothetical protein
VVVGREGFSTKCPWVNLGFVIFQECGTRQVKYLAVTQFLLSKISITISSICCGVIKDITLQCL